MNIKSISLSNIAKWALALGLVAVMFFSAIGPAYAAVGGIYIDTVSVSKNPGDFPTYGHGGAVSYTVTVLCKGTGNGATFTPAVSSLTLPGDVNVNFNPATLSWNNGCKGYPNPQTTTLTLTTSNSTPGNLGYQFSVDVGGKSGVNSLTVNGIVLAVKGLVVANKQYDGTVTATPDFTSVYLDPSPLSGDVAYVNLSCSSGTATFDFKDVGTRKATASGCTLSGSKAGNYQIQQPYAYASISKADLSITVDTVAPKVYDGTTGAIVTLIAHGVLGDDVSAAGVGAFDAPDAGPNQHFTVQGIVLSGQDAANYNQLTASAAGYAPISKKALTAVIPDNQTMSDAAITLPIFTAHYATGDLVGSDQPSDMDTPPTCGIAQSLPLAVGTYEISCTAGTGLDNNYSFASADYSAKGTLSVTASGAPVLGSAPSSLNFLSQLNTTTSLPQFVTLDNSLGSLPLHISDVSLTGTGFSLLTTGDGTCYNGSSWAVTLDPGASCKAYITFTPTAAVVYNGTLSVSSDGGSASIGVVGLGSKGKALLKNNSFEFDADLNTIPDAWSKGLRDCTVFSSGACSLQLVGNGTTLVAQQVIRKSGAAGRGFAFSLRNMASHVPAGAAYSVSVQLYNGRVKVGTATVVPMNKGTHGWQTVSGHFTAPAAFTKIVFRISYRAAGGTVWFDVANLKW